MSTPKLIERFLDREETALPDIYLPKAHGAVLAGDDLPGADTPTKYEWRATIENKVFEAWTKDGDLLSIEKLGDYWFVMISDGPFPEEKWQGLVFAFDRLPICTHSAEQAMRLAEHCYPNPRPPMAGCWEETRVVLPSGDRMRYRNMKR